MRVRSPVGDRTGKGLRPVRVERQEHQERSIGINTDASSEKSAELRRQARTKVKEKHGGVESLFVQDSEEEAGDARGGEGDDLVEITSEKAVGGTLYGGIRIKEEPTDDRDVLMADSIPQGVDDRPATTDTGPLAPAALKPKARKNKVTVHDPRSKLQTEEERQEWDRHEQDIEHIKQALGTITTHDPPAEESQGTEQEDETKAVEAPRDERSGRLFLIQFPPMTPNLVPPWPDMDEMNQDVVETGARASTQQSPNPTIKKEVTDGLTAPMPTLPSNGTVIPSPLITATNPTLPPGRVVLGWIFHRFIF
ncbi:DNA-directed RNA polymerase III RPC4 [Histoplasma capsulatum]|uniref:DNA-directed RNA polymerase III RPC4 n=1 Tax=Ajellomyces capsulatus TaxID=5037 RepID=A0A8A1M5Y6_AJECA|nr:DNA-directed RNA polymerase III RPC4 [Histoplasma capsulatum]